MESWSPNGATATEKEMDGERGMRQYVKISDLLVLSLDGVASASEKTSTGSAKSQACLVYASSVNFDGVYKARIQVMSDFMWYLVKFSASTQDHPIASQQQSFRHCCLSAEAVLFLHLFFSVKADYNHSFRLDWLHNSSLLSRKLSRHLHLQQQIHIHNTNTFLQQIKRLRQGTSSLELHIYSNKA
nr:hypothetical protein Itr_chr04CG11930 [Ipomoea trifida]